MAKKLLVVILFLAIFLIPVYANAEDFKYIEIFDPKQGEIVKVVQSNSEIQNMIAGWIKNIQGLYGRNDPITDDGYAIKVPLDPAVKVNCKSLKAIVNEVYIIIPETEPPFYMIFQDKNKVFCYPFNGSIDMLSESLDFKLNCK